MIPLLERARLCTPPGIDIRESVPNLEDVFIHLQSQAGDPMRAFPSRVRHPDQGIHTDAA
jgi:hypothetical protein